MRIALGWSPDIVDPRDTHADDESSLTLDTPYRGTPCHTLPASIDLCEGVDEFIDYEMSEVDATVAQTVMTLIDWQSRRRTGESLRRSCLYLHQMTQRLYGGGGVHGVGFRSTFKALRRFGSPPESIWPSTAARLNVPPEGPELHGFSSDFQRLQYVRIDVGTQLHRDGVCVRLQHIKRILAHGTPCLCGFSVPDFIERVICVPFRANLARVIGGAAILIVGYDDSIRVDGPNGNDRGALRFRSCWGIQWGDGGFGWLPYAYVEQRLASDFWYVLIRP